MKLLMIDGSSLCIDANMILIAETARTQGGEAMPGKSKVTTQAGPLPLPVNQTPEEIWERRALEIKQLLEERSVARVSS